MKEMMMSFDHISLKFVRRSANQTAHSLARESVSLTDCKEWCLYPPDFICNVLYSDLN
ncbi:reverse transcriptase-like protein [Escherichia coli]|uniref:reverse transcriptase-like protein n=1 Tax=Escherichia coli TaxID=562 RepID=UPI003D81A728